jgi:hypothetical protein
MEDRYCRLQSSRLKSADGEISRMARFLGGALARAVLAMWAAVATAQTQGRVALVVGNCRYDHIPARSPPLTAPSCPPGSPAIRAMGFSTAI